MPLVVIVEDGSGVTNANSYDTLANVRLYNVQRGVVLDSDDDTVVAQMTAAMDYIETYEFRWYGDRALPLVQALSWPRCNAYVWGKLAMPIASTAIPAQLKNALAYLTGVVSTGVDLYNVQDTRFVTKEVIGPLETDYSATAGATVTPMIPNLDAILRPLIRVGVGSLTSVRV